MSTLAPTLQAFFTDRLARQRQASSGTVAAYRDALKLLLIFAERRTGKPPHRLEIANLDAPLIGAFLDHLQTDRHNSVRTRNARLAAIHALFRYAATRHPEDAAVIQRVLAIPTKRYDRRIVTYLTTPEVEALLGAPDRTTWTGRRDYAMLALAVQTGLRAGELLGLTVSDIHLGAGAHVSCIGKGRKQRVTPLTRGTVAVLDTWLTERGGRSVDPAFPTRRGTPLTRDALERRVALHAATAARSCATLLGKKVTAHTMRHTCAMQLLESGLEATVIALWLGHASVATTQVYIHADLALKERALARTAPPSVTPGRYRPTDRVLAFLDSL